jgi:hypothetical protein
MPIEVHERDGSVTAAASVEPARSYICRLIICS